MDLLNNLKKFLKSSKVLEGLAYKVYGGIPYRVYEKFTYGTSYSFWTALLKESRTWDIQRVEEYQIEQLKTLLVHSSKNVPYYGKSFSEFGFNPEKIQSLDDIKVLPYLTKEIIRDRPDEFVDTSVPLKSLIPKLTSGSTGIPMTIYRNKMAVSAFHAFRADLLNRIGHTHRSKEVMFWNMIELGKDKNLPFMKYGNKLILSGRHLSNEWLSKYVDMMWNFKPEFISGFPSTLSIFATFVKNGNNLNLKNLKAIIVYAETLYDWQRKLIEEVFKVRVFSMYAMTELAVIGGECEYSNSVHFYPQYGLTEFKAIDSGYSEVIVTGFTNYAMPFIRYRTGDIVTTTKEFCNKCGRYHQIADSIEGRINDFLIGRKGEIIPRLMPWIKTFPNIKQCQFFQEEPGKVILKLIKTEAYSDTDSDYIILKFKESLGPMSNSLDIEIVFVDNISATSSGKINLVDQRLNVREFLGV